VADSMTTTGSVGLDQTAYERLAYFALRPQLHYDLIADVQATRQSIPSAVVTFTIITDLSVATTELNESVDIDAVALADSTVVVTLKEYGNAVNTTLKLRATSFVEVNPIVANVIGYNAGRSIDSVAEVTARAGSNVRYSGQATSRDTVIPTDKLTAANVRRAQAELAGADVMPNRGNLYTAYIHPDVKYDFIAETGSASWRDPHTYSQPNNIWISEIGAFEGFTFIETPRAPLFANAGSSTTLTDVYGTLFTGRQAIAKGYSVAEGCGAQPRVIMSPVVDKLRRFVPVGWHHFVGYARFREAALRRVESASSIGTNA
jgi:N4-gp56 family major capsid protein